MGFLTKEGHFFSAMRDSKDVKEKISLSFIVLVITDYSRAFLFQIRDRALSLKKHFHYPYINLSVHPSIHYIIEHLQQVARRKGACQLEGFLLSMQAFMARALSCGNATP